jgi:hypothetical protein
VIYVILAIGSAALAVAAGIWDGYRLRHEARYSPLVMGITAGGPVISLLLFLMVGGLELKLPITLGLLAVGAATGAWIARLSRLTTVVPCEDEEPGDAAEPCLEGDVAGAEPADKPAAAPRLPQVRLVGASWLPLPAAFAVAALQVATAFESAAWEVLALAALEAAVAFGVASAVVLIRRRSNFGRANAGRVGEPREPGVDTPAAASGERSLDPPAAV